MKQRFNIGAAPEAYRAMLGLEKYLAKCSIETKLVHLLKVRASQINGCAYCIDMHWKDSRAAGETEQRLYGLAAWEESPYYSERERAALLWTDTLTRVAENHVPDDVYERVKAHFNETELVDLTLAVTTINAWNRITIAARAPVGTYKPGQFAEK